MPLSDSDSDEEEETPEFLPHEPLVLWEPNEAEIEEGKVPVQVPTVLAQFLRYVYVAVHCTSRSPSLRKSRTNKMQCERL